MSLRNKNVISVGEDWLEWSPDLWGVHDVATAQMLAHPETGEKATVTRGPAELPHPPAGFGLHPKPRKSSRSRYVDSLLALYGVGSRKRRERYSGDVRRIRR